MASPRLHRLALKFVVGTVLFLCLDEGALAQGNDVASDKAALEALYDATDGANWTRHTNWKSNESLSTWFGVGVDSNGRVTSVNLANDGLSGSLPAAIGDLDKLERLFLDNNALHGVLPSELENLASLEELRLSTNRALTGPLPSGMSDLPNVDTLTIGFTELCVPDEADFQTWLENITFIGLICPPASQSTIDLAVFYTPAARESAGGSNAIEAEIDLMVAETNKAYQDGAVNQRVALVAVAEVDYTESNDHRTDLRRLRSTSDGHMDGVHARRDQSAADIVVLVRHGIRAAAYLMGAVSTRFDGEAFATLGISGNRIFGGAVTFAHELGHVMGLHHDRFEECDAGSCSSAAFPYAYGYVNQRAFDQGAATTARWRSIMSYNTQCSDAGFSCQRLLRFSTPDQIHPDPGGDPLGKSGLEPSNAVDGPSDAVRVLNRTRGYVEKFRGAPQITVSFAADQYTATEGGSAANVTVRLSEEPTRPVEISLVSMGSAGGSVYDFEVPTSVGFAAQETERSFTVTAVNDSADEDSESVTLSFGSPLPAGVNASGTTEATVTLVDNDTVLEAPSIVSVDLTSEPGPKGAYAPSDEIEASVRFNKSVVVTGSPQLALTLGSDSPDAAHNTTAGDVLWFDYSVREGDSAPDGITIRANSLSTNGGTIKDGASQDAGLTHSAVSADSKHPVDAVKPGLSSANVDADMLTLTFDEALDEAFVPEAGGNAGAIRVTVGTETKNVTQVTLSGDTLTVEFEPQVVHGDTVTLSYTPGTRPIQDLVGNRAESFSSRMATNDTAMPHYDQDQDGLIGVSTLAQLNAIRHDLDGNGAPTAAGASTYRDAFPDAFPTDSARLRCGGTGCTGYELHRDLDFDTDDSGSVGAGDSYWNGGAGWVPIGMDPDWFFATFQGNGHRVRNLFINRPSSTAVGLFGVLAGSSITGGPIGLVRGVGLSNVDVTGNRGVGALAGFNWGTIVASFATGRVSGAGSVGGLVGSDNGGILASYANVIVAGTDAVGGLAGIGYKTIASYATGRVSATGSATFGTGGLNGRQAGDVSASYTTAHVSTSGRRDSGLIGRYSSGSVNDSYWDTDTSGLTSGNPGSGQTAENLQSPEDFAGIYANWNLDLDGDNVADDPWDFGDTGDYPALQVDMNGDGTKSWTEFGYQLREGPDLMAASESGQVMLSWTAVDASAWDPSPTVVYTVIRNDGTNLETVATGLETLTYTDHNVTGGDTYTYQVAAGVDTGEATRSTIEEVTVITEDSTPPSIESIDSNATHPTKDRFTVTITFSEPVTDLMADEVSVTNGTGSNFSGSGASYSLRVTPDADFEGDVTVTVPAGAAKDGSDNTSEAGSETFEVDTRAPALVTTGAVTVNGATLTLTFDEALANANTPASAFAVTGGTNRTITNPHIVGTTVVLTIGPPALHGETDIEVDYSAPSQNALTDGAGNRVASFVDRAVSNEMPASTVSTEVTLSLDTDTVAEEGGAKTVVVTGTLNRSARPTATAVTVMVGGTGDSATEGADYTTVDDLTLTVPAYATSGTVNFTLTPVNDRIDEQDERLRVTGSTTVSGLPVTPSGGLSIDITDNDGAPSLVLSVDKSSFAEDGGTATLTVGTGSGSTFETAQTVDLSVAGTATETTDYTISSKRLTLPAGVGTTASMVSSTLTGVDDDVDDDGETVVVSGARNGVAFGDRRTVTIDDDDDPEVTVSFSQAEYRVAEGGNVDVTIALSAVPERQVTIPVEAEGADGAESADFSISPSSVSFGVNETTKTVRVSATNDSAVDPGESVTLSFGTPLPDRVSAGSTAQASVTIRDTDFTFEPAFAARSGTTEPETGVFAADEDEGALHLTLELATPRGVSVEDIPDPVVVTLASRENAGSRGTDEDYATQRRSGTFGDYGAYSRDLSFAPVDFSNDSTCGCAVAEKSVSVDLFNDRTYEPTEVFGLRVSRKSGRLSVSSEDITIRIGEDDAEPALTLDVNPAAVAEAGGTSTVTVSTGTGSTFPTAQAIDLVPSGTATENSDFEIDAKRLTLPAGTGTTASSVTTTVHGLDDAIDDDAETIVLSATRAGAEFASRTLTITDDDAGSTQVDLALNPAQVREDASSATVRVTASLNAGARSGDTDVAVTVGSVSDSAVEGTDYQTIGTLTLTIDDGEMEADTTFTLRPTNDSTAEGTEEIMVDGSASGLAVNAATLTLNDDDVESTEVALTVDPNEVGEAVGSRTVRVTGTLNGGARTSNTLVTVAVGASSDSAAEGTDYTDVGELELSIPANRTDGSVTFTLRPTNDVTAEGDETISVSGDVAGLTVKGTELVLADNDAVSTHLSLSLRPDRVSEGAAPTDVTVTGTLDAGARETETLVTVTVGAPADSAVSDTDYAAVSNQTLTIPANETRAEITFTLTPHDDAVAEGAESITVGGSVSGLTVDAASLTLSDNDTPSRVIMLAADPPSVREDTPEQVTITAGLDAAARIDDTTVRLSIGAAGDTAVPGTDYRRVDEAELTILAGTAAATVTFFLEPLDNDSADGPRALRVTGTTPTAELRVEPASGARVDLEDDDVPAILVVPAQLAVIEAGSSDYQVTLQTAPTADVTVTIGGVSGDLSLNRTSLVFTPGDFDVAQTVSVIAADDHDNIQDADVTLTHRASGATEYRGLSAQLVVSIRENDPALVFSGTSVAVPEGGMAEYTVELATEPTTNVTVSISGVSGDLTVFPTDFEFTRGTWDIPKPVTVEAAEDDDTSTDPSVTLTHRASGGGYDGIAGTVRVSITEKDAPPPGGGGGGGGAANIPPVVERVIPAQTLAVGEVLELDIRLSFYDRDQRALDYIVESVEPSVATVEMSGETTLAIRGIARGTTAVTVTAADRRDARASQTFAVTVTGPAHIPFVPRASDPLGREGFVRVINHSDEDGEVSIEATDDAGARYGPIALALEAGETVHFNSGDLEDGNAAKGLPDGVGAGAGDWRLVLDSELDFEVLAYIRTDDGFLTAMHDTVPAQDGTYRVAIFNPGSNPNQVSRLRVINPGEAAAEVTVSGIDDAGASPGTLVMFEIAAGESLTLTAADLETGAGVDGALGDGAGKWRLQVTSNAPIEAMSLLSSPTGHLTNLSTVPAAPGDEDGTHVVPLFPSASDPLGRQGFVRVVNRSTDAGAVRIESYDDSELLYETVSLAMEAGATVHFNSNDLELGNTAKGLSGSTGAGVGDWRLGLSSELDIQVLAYIRTSDGFLTSMHDVAPSAEGRHWVAILNPGSNPSQVSRLRLVNPGDEDAQVTIEGVDDAGATPDGPVVLTVPAGASCTLTSAQLENGGDGLTRALGDGVGKWRLLVESSQPLIVMSLLSSPTGHLTNLSTAPDRGLN